MSFRPGCRLLGILCLCGPFLVACAKPTLPVSIHGVNYSGEAFSYVVVDPNDPKNTGGGELVDPYSAGGTTCCFELPRQWHAGLKVTINATHWLGKLADGSLREVVGTHAVDLPPYPNGQPGELWVLRNADGTMGLVSSDVQPDHPNWPGKVRGWPVPSLAYQRERWGIYVEHERGGVKLFDELLKELNATPQVRAVEEWNFSMEHDKKSLSGFAGPTDLKFLAKLRLEYEDGLKRSQQQLEQLEKVRP